MNFVYVAVENKKQAEEVIEKLENVGYRISIFPEILQNTKTICVFNYGVYQLLSGDEFRERIKAEEVMTSSPVRQFMEVL